MAEIRAIQILGEAEGALFEGEFRFAGGPEVISAHNAYGKSLAVAAIAWCLALEPLFGLTPADASLFPDAVRGEILLGGEERPVSAAEARLELARADGTRLVLVRAIHPEPGRSIRFIELSPEGGTLGDTRLLLGGGAMTDGVGGFQSALLKWLGLPSQQLMTNRGRESYVYWENIAALFFVEQLEGWSDIQSRQVRKYGLRDIEEATVEYLLGSDAELRRRFAEQSSDARQVAVRHELETLLGRLAGVLASHGMAFRASTHKSLAALVDSWRDVNLRSWVFETFHYDVSSEQVRLRNAAEQARVRLGGGTLDRNEAGHAIEASQEVIDLKSLLHAKAEETAVLRAQIEEQMAVMSALDQRIQSAKDLQRLKMDGIGILPTVPCPVCHRAVDPSTFDLSVHGGEMVEDQIGSLQKEREAVRYGASQLEQSLQAIAVEVAEGRDRLFRAQRTLEAVNQAVTSARESEVALMATILELERDLERAQTLNRLLDELQAELGAWVKKAEAALVQPETGAGPNRSKKAAFEDWLRRFLLALGHDEVTADNIGNVHLDDTYVPYLRNRRLRALGSASDRARLVFSYVAALLQVAARADGHHPGFVVLDEPLQQNPDVLHQRKFIDFITKDWRELRGQVLMFTSLSTAQITGLGAGGVAVQEHTHAHFLRLRDDGPGGRHDDGR